MALQELVIRCIFDPDDGEFTGFLCGPEGKKIGSVSGNVPVDFFVNELPHRRRGRPPEYQKHIAVMAGTNLAVACLGRKLWQAQTMVADALCIGSSENPDDQKRAVQRHIEKAKKYLSDTVSVELFWWPPDDKAAKAIWVLFEPGVIVTSSDRTPEGTSTVTLKGNGWSCRWGEAKAKFGTVTLSSNNQTDEHVRGMTEIFSK